MAWEDGDLVFLHQEDEALGMLVDDALLALLDGVPVELAFAEAFDAVLHRMLQVVIDFGIEQQGLGGDAAPVQAGAAELAFFFNQRDFQAILAGANGRRVTGRAAADDGDVIDGFSQGNAPFR